MCIYICIYTCICIYFKLIRCLQGAEDFPGGGSQQQLVPCCAAFEKLQSAGWLPGGCNWDGAGEGGMGAKSRP